MQDEDIFVENSKRVTKNTFFLYFRLSIIIVLNFVITRELLNALGVVDFGLVSVIGSVVTMFSFISTTMSSAISRYFNFELGKNDFDELNKTFNISLQIYLLIIMILLLLSETIGIYFLNTKINIPEGYYGTIFWFYQASVATFLINIAAIPFYSLVISHENMNVYAVLSILENVGKLAIIFLLFLFSANRLPIYGLLLAAISLFHFFAYYIYCRVKYEETRFKLVFDFKKFKELVLFGGWNLWGAISVLFSDLFINILLNNFFGGLVNAARSIALQASGGLATFATNFMTASRPQITKYWASNDYNSSAKLSIISSKIGFYLVLIPLLPIIFDTSYILRLWLGKDVEYTVIFTRLILIKTIILTTAYPLMTMIQATGKIAFYQFSIGMIYWLNLPVSYIFLKLGYAPETTIIVAIAIEIICFIVRIALIKKITGFKFYKEYAGLFFRAVCVSAISAIIPILICAHMEQSFYRFLMVGLSSLIVSCIAIYNIGLDNGSKTFIMVMLEKYLGNKKIA